MSDYTLSEQEILRREKRETLKKLGISPYPSINFETNTTTQAIANHYATCPDKFKNIVIAGRLMTRRIMGAASFSVLQDETGQIQL